VSGSLWHWFTRAHPFGLRLVAGVTGVAAVDICIRHATCRCGLQVRQRRWYGLGTATVAVTTQFDRVVREAQTFVVITVTEIEIETIAKVEPASVRTAPTCLLDPPPASRLTSGLRLHTSYRKRLRIP
jgi:hypothetical protein